MLHLPGDLHKLPFLMDTREMGAGLFGAGSGSLGDAAAVHHARGRVSKAMKKAGEGIAARCAGGELGNVDAEKWRVQKAERTPRDRASPYASHCGGHWAASIATLYCFSFESALSSAKPCVGVLL